MVLKIFKMIATSSFLTVLECTKFVLCQGCAPDPTGGAYSAPPDPLAALMGTNSKEEEEGREKGRERGMGEERKVRHRPPFRKFLGPPLCWMLD